MHWSQLVIALKAQQRTLQIFDLEQRQRLKSAAMNEDVLFWKWFGDKNLGLVTDTSIYHWNVFDSSQSAPGRIFERHPSLQVGAAPFPVPRPARP